MPFNPTDHISIYSRPRPIRIAFLIDVDNSPENLRKAILDFNVKLWGGRLNPIIPVSKGDIPSGYWNLMQLYDPDIVYSYADLPIELIRKIDIKISPYYFLVHKEHKEREKDDFYKFTPQLNNDFLPIDFNVLPKGIMNPFAEKFSFLICHNSKDWEHYLFLQTNFGIYNDQHMHQPPSELERWVISEKSTPEIFLKQIVEKRRNLLCPWQFTVSEVPSREFHDDKSYRHDCFTIVVGDSIWNWLYVWNKILLLSTYKRIEINQLYLPSVFIDSATLLPLIKNLISIHAYRSDSQPPTVVFASSDVDKDKLTSISQKFTEKIDAFPQAKPLSQDFDELKSLTGKRWYYSPKFPQHDYVSGKKFYLKPPRPQLRGKIQRGKWMVDFKIEYHPQKFSYTNMSYWWKLPRFAFLASCFLERGAGAIGRIDNNGYISVCTGGEVNQDLGLRIPDDNDIIYLLLTRQQHTYFMDDVRYSPTPQKPIYGHIQLSDKGRYLNGYLSLVGNLFNAGSLVEHHFWRSVFNTMCGRNNKNETDVLSGLKTKIVRRLPNVISNCPSGQNEKPKYFSREVDYLTGLFLRFARRLTKAQNEITFSELLRLFEEERKAFVQMPGHTTGFDISPERNRADLLEVLKELTSLKILLQGVKPKCPRCGFKTWYSIDDISFELICEGCQFQMNIPPEIEWVYRLNSFVQDIIQYHGTFPVVWVLSQMLHWSRESFIFRPCLELREDYDSRSILAEIDVACILDGKFIIGEIKTKASEFSSEEIENLCTVARNVLPSQVVIGAFEPPYDNLKEVSKKINENLKDLGIDVRIECPTSQLNEPEYHPYF